MNVPAPSDTIPRAQRLTERALAAIERFVHIEAASGVILVLVAIVAMAWANSPYAEQYHHLWHVPLSIGVGDYVFSQSLHFWINDALMTVFFLVVGMEIRREMHEGSLSDLRQAGLPIAAAFGGVLVPALIYVALNPDPARHHGWAVPTATDIAFAVGVLTLLGRAVPANVRVFLLALAIIDDIIAVLIIALFYSGGLDYSGFLVAGLGVLMVLAFQRMGIWSAYAYVLPGAILWIGLLMTGAHPTLAGVVLGLMTPVVAVRMRESPLDVMARAAGELADMMTGRKDDSARLERPLRSLRLAQRELLPPVVRVQSTLHPWVAFVIMPLFALANAGVSLGGIDLGQHGAQWVAAGVALALVLGKPIGVVLCSWLAVRLGLCRLPPEVSWRWVWLVGLLAGIGFTMSIFIAMLAFRDENLLGAAKLGVLGGSLVAGLLGLMFGFLYVRKLRRDADAAQREASAAAV